MKNIINRARARVVVVGLAAAPLFARADGGDMDVSSVVAKIAIGAAAVATIGAASLGLKVGIKLWNKMSAAL